LKFSGPLRWPLPLGDTGLNHRTQDNPSNPSHHEALAILLLGPQPPWRGKTSLIEGCTYDFNRLLFTFVWSGIGSRVHISFALGGHSQLVSNSAYFAAKTSIDGPIPWTSRDHRPRPYFAVQMVAVEGHRRRRDFSASFC
jgi:hypothetical protein